MCQLSVIIPMYNGKQYIYNTVNEISKLSCLHEILIVDDGSKDDSYAYCEELFSGRQDIKLHRKPNGGIADTRNYGLSRARGDFVLFVDQDDKINAPVVDRAVDIISNQDMDAVFWSTVFEYENGEIKPCDSINKDCMVVSSAIIDTIIPDMMSREANEYTTYPGHVWGAVYKKSLIEKYGIHFKKFVDYEDDLIFVFDYLLKASKVFFLKDIGYFWKTNLESYSHVRKYVKDYINQTERLYEYFNIKYNEATGKKFREDVINYFGQYTIVSAIKNASYSGHRGKEDIKNIRLKLKEKCYKSVFSAEAFHLKDKREKFTYNLVKYKMTWFAIWISRLYYQLRRKH